MDRSSLRRPASAATTLLIAWACAGSPAPLPEPPPPAPTESGRLLQEVEYALAAIERRHPDPFGRRPRRGFEKEIGRLRAEGERIDRRTAFFALMRLVALVGDAHTRLGDRREIEDIEIPVRIESWSDGFWVATVRPDRRDLFGLRVEAVGELPIEEVVARLAPLVPHENDLVLRQGVARLLCMPRALIEVGVVAEGAPVRLALVDTTGGRAEVDLDPRPREEDKAWAFFAPKGWSAPIHQVRKEENWWWRVLDDGRTLYLQYNRCVDRAEDPLSNTARAILARIDAGRIRRVIVDLRNNGGGDSRVLGPLVRGLRARRERLGSSGVVALIGHGTFSSGMMNAWELRERCGAVLVGEPTGQKPDAFGEVRSVDLPNTGWRLDCSTKTFRLVGDDRPSLAPDVHVSSGFADLLAGRDPALERALRDGSVLESSREESHEAPRPLPPPAQEKAHSPRGEERVRKG